MFHGQKNCCMPVGDASPNLHGSATAHIYILYWWGTDIIQATNTFRKWLQYYFPQKLVNGWRNDFVDGITNSTQPCKNSASVIPETDAHTHPFNGPLSGTIQVSWNQKGKTSLDLLEQEIVSGSGISWAICKSAPRPTQLCQHPITHFLQAGCPSCRPTNSVKALKALRNRQQPDNPHSPGQLPFNQYARLYIYTI